MLEGSNWSVCPVTREELRYRDDLFAISLSKRGAPGLGLLLAVSFGDAKGIQSIRRKKC
jgi:hypothetical protein